MKVFGLLSWWDERPEWLQKCIASLGKVPIDHLIAVDGAYALMPGGTPASHPAQAAMIRAACNGIKAKCTIHTPDELWPGEVEKRSFMFALAERHATPLEDWYFVMDADQVIGRCQQIRERLEQTDCDVADTYFIERPDPAVPGSTASRFPIRNLFRAIPGLHVEDNHYTYRTPDGRYLWGNPTTDQLEPSLDLRDLQIAHKTYYRDPERRARAVQYYEARDTQNAELKRCADCDSQATCTVYIDWRWHPNGRQLIAGSMPACDRCAKKRRWAELANFRRMGIDPNSAVRWQGYATVPD